MPRRGSLNLTSKGIFHISNLIVDNKIIVDQFGDIVNNLPGTEKEKESYIVRTYDGSNNNLKNPNWGRSNTPLVRKAPNAYADGVSTISDRTPSPREVSNAICSSSGDVANSLNLTDMVWGFGQFLDHEIDLTPDNSAEPVSMITPSGDLYPGRTIPFNRSITAFNSSPREQLNKISSYIDGTNVYGFDSYRAHHLRLMDGTGKLKTSTADNSEVILPLNAESLDNAQPTGSDKTTFYLAGDIRANENVLLTAIHTLFLREHNRLCDEIISDKPELTGKDEVVYQHARRKVIGMMQTIAYNEYLPKLIGDSCGTYNGYDNTINASINNEFSSVLYRLGHAMVSSNIKLDASGGSVLALRDAFFSPSWIKANGIEPPLLGSCHNVMKEINNEISDDLRVFLFSSPSVDFLHDLPAFNIQRGRDHGIPDYNSLREAYGLEKYTSWSQITSNTTLQSKLSSTYPDIDSVDPWIGCLCEDHVSGCAVGPLLKAGMTDQFKRLRDGDRFWCELDLGMSVTEKSTIRNTKFSDIIKRNTSLTNIPDDVFQKS